MTTDTEVRPATPTERAIAAMLVENTGAAMMDSGMYGRAWQRTRAQFGLDGGLPNSSFHGGPGHRVADPTKDEIERVALLMREQPPASIDHYGTVSVDTFHFLTDHLDYEAALDARFQRWVRVHNMGKDRWDHDWGLPAIEAWIGQLALHAEVTGIYGDGDPAIENSYNGECALDRTVQIALFTIENREGPRPYEPLPDGSYVVLQIHGGADVRGGYTDPVLFWMSDEYGVIDWARVSIRCTDPRPDGGPMHEWQSENGGYSFNLDGMWGQGESVLAFDGYSVEKGARKPTWDEDHGRWLCPYDNTRLEVSPW